MAFVHGKNAFVSLNASDLSTYSNNVVFGRVADSHDTTTFGKNAKTYQGGLTDGTCTISGIYDNGAAGPRAIIEPLIGSTVELIYRPEGTGSGRPEDTVDVVVTSYEETAPVADMIAWTCELQLSDDVATVDQS